MRKITMMVGVALSAGLLLTNCVKNEEADGVKALREAQAELISAKAGAATSAAADATTLANATAAIDLAKAAYKEAEAAKLVLENELLAAENELEAAKIQFSIDSLAARAEIDLNAAIAEADSMLAVNQKNLANALASLATSEAAKQGVYYTNYTNALNALNLAQLDVYNDKVDIADATYYLGTLDESGSFSESTAEEDEYNLLSWIADKKEIADLEVERGEAWYATAKAIVETALGDNTEAIAAAQAEVSSFEDQIETKTIEAQELDATYELEFEKMEQAYDAYKDAMGTQNAVAYFDTEYDEEDAVIPSSYVEGDPTVDAEFLEEYNDLPSWNHAWGDIDDDASVGFGADGSYATIAYQEYRIAIIEGNIESYEATVDKVTDLYNTYHVELDELYDTYVEENAKLPELLHAWNVAEIDAEAHPDDDAKQDANTEAEEDYNDQFDIVSDAWDAYIEFLENVDDAEILNGTGYYTWIGNASVNGGVDDGDTNHADILEYMTSYDSFIEEYEAQIEMYEDVIDLLEAYVTWLGTADVDTYKDAYFAAREAWQIAQADYDVIQDEIEIIEEQYDSAMELLQLLLQDDTTGDLTDDDEDIAIAVDTFLEDIADALAEVQKEAVAYEKSLTDATYILEYLNQKLANDEAIVVEAEAVVADTLEALNAELGVEAGE